ncbi:protein charybde-like [Onthophagus taurus]|uniref:protein charybde-like n=1 Tax=Onthophagus taurus TaxID=166361 RepID=UPI000C2017D2|nr:protein charybde-like [Onthophagus taurus]
MFKNGFQEERVEADSRLQHVFSKLTGVFPKAGDLGNGQNQKVMSSDIIESVLADSPIPVQNWNFDSYSSQEDCNSSSITSLSNRLEMELRTAKRTHLSCGEVLLPCGLLQRIARDVLAMAESEPCGLRGCVLYLEFEGENGNMKLSTIKCDPMTAATFELYLTLKQSVAGWNSFIPQFIKNLTRGAGTVMISPAYTLSKNKLYRSYID